MDIQFKSTKLKKDCGEFKRCVRRWGLPMAKLIRLRLDELRDSDNLAIMATLPQARLHELKENRKGQLAVKLKGPYRLIFIPINEPIPKNPDGGLDLQRITAIKILEVTDYHG